LDLKEWGFGEPGVCFLQLRLLMPHYVNIAWGNFLWQAFLFAGLGQLFGFGFSPLKFQIKKKQNQCAA
jgi:hypothetical protein